MLLWGEGVDFAAPESELAASDLLVDFQRNIIDHTSGLTAYLVAVFHEVFCAESLNCE